MTDLTDALALDLWRLQMPVSTRRKGKVDEYGPAELTVPGFAVPPWYQPGHGNGVRMRAHVGGAVTSARTKHARCEYRELNADGTPAAWSATDGRTHRLDLRLAVAALPPARPRLVFAQIHDGDDDVAQIGVEGSRVWARFGDDGEDVVFDDTYRAGDALTVSLEVFLDTVRVYHGDEWVMSHPVTGTSLYFKAGCYVQSTAEREGNPGAYGEVVLYEARPTHGPAKPAAPPPVESAPVVEPPAPVTSQDWARESVRLYVAGRAAVDEGATGKAATYFAGARFALAMADHLTMSAPFQPEVPGA